MESECSDPVLGRPWVSPVALGTLRLGPRTQVKRKRKLCPVVSEVISDYIEAKTGGSWGWKKGLGSEDTTEGSPFP